MPRRARARNTRNLAARWRALVTSVARPRGTGGPGVSTHARAGRFAALRFDAPALPHYGWAMVRRDTGPSKGVVRCVRAPLVGAALGVLVVACAEEPGAGRTAADSGAVDRDGAVSTTGDGGVGGLPTKPVGCPALPTLGGATQKKVPAAWIARNFVEALGRLPTHDEWNFTLAATGSSCNADALKGVAALYNSEAFLALPYTARERGLAMYRGLIAHDPRVDELDRLAAYQEARPDGLCDAIRFLITSQQFSAHAATICSPKLANYHYEKGFPAVGAGEPYPEAELRSALDAAEPGDEVTLPRGAWVQVRSPLLVKRGVTLRTEGLGNATGGGAADVQAYARYARLIRAGSYKGPIVQVKEGGHLDALWLDGRIADYANVTGDDKLGPNVFTEPTVNEGSSVTHLRSDNPASAQNLRIGSYAGKECKHEMLVERNLVVNSGNDNRASGPRPIWSDGIFTHCETSTVRENEVLDASDVALILFVSENGKQRSVISNNRVLSAGNDAFGGLVIDTWNGFRCDFAPCDFAGAGFEDNVLWSGPNTRFVFALSTASAPWSFIPGHGTARGARFIGNSSGEARIRTQVPLYGAHLLDADVRGNWDGKLIDYVDPAGSVPLNRCAKSAALVERSSTSGHFQPAASGSRTDCI